MTRQAAATSPSPITHWQVWDQIHPRRSFRAACGTYVLAKEIAEREAPASCPGCRTKQIAYDQAEEVA